MTQRNHLIKFHFHSLKNAGKENGRYKDWKENNETILFLYVMIVFPEDLKKSINQ